MEQSDPGEVIMVSFQDRRTNRAVGFIAFCLTAMSAFAGLTPKLAEWGTGPAQWIMTSEEQRAWRKLTTDSDAVKFIDLFWVRRDPTLDTAVNEFRNEFESRVAFSDKTFVEKRKRGAMSDRGRVYIVLGPATNMGSAFAQSTAQMGVSAGGNNNPTGGRQMGARDIWIWEQRDARKFDMGRIEVVFVEDPTTRGRQRDPQRTDFGRANPVAIKKAIVNPELTAVPAWAPSGGLEPVAPLTISDVPAPEIPADILASDEAADPSDVDVKNEGPVVASNAPGVSRLTLLPGKWIDSDSSTDPFTGHIESTFKSGDDVRWAVQFCSAKAELPRLKFMLLIVGPLDGGSKEQATRQKDAKPERMAAQPGCYVLQGPMPKLTAGRYKLSVLIDDSASGEIYDVNREFRVE